MYIGDTLRRVIGRLIEQLNMFDFGYEYDAKKPDMKFH